MIKEEFSIMPTAMVGQMKLCPNVRNLKFRRPQIEIEALQLERLAVHPLSVRPSVVVAFHPAGEPITKRQFHLHPLWI